MDHRAYSKTKTIPRIPVKMKYDDLRKRIINKYAELGGDLGELFF